MAKATSATTRRSLATGGGRTSERCGGRRKRSDSSWLQPAGREAAGQGSQDPTRGGASTTVRTGPLGEDGAVTQTPGPEPTVMERLREQPSPFLLTGYAVEQVLWIVPLVIGLVFFVVGGLLVVVWVGI